MNAGEELLSEIEAERCCLNELVKKGLDHPAVLRQSRRVDDLLRRYHPG
ncbi:MAG: aspartyl-phosphate phosphatase Spo0E family protein [Clostridiales bacterium]|nr:aspartyl-phosphate phosphatase Spo0E family protein [Clostridiales bacterium]